MNLSFYLRDSPAIIKSNKREVDCLNCPGFCSYFEKVVCFTFSLKEILNHKIETKRLCNQVRQSHSHI